MYPRDQRHGRGTHRKGHYISERKGAAAPFTARQASHENIINGNLAEYGEHEANSNEKRRHPTEMRHNRKKNRLCDRDNGKDRAQGLCVEKIAHDELRHGRYRKHYKGIPAHKSCSTRKIGQPLVKNLW
jgi:hypothetical protein